MFELLETYSGHGNAEEYRSWRGVNVVRDGEEIIRPFTFPMGEIDLDQGTFTLKNQNGPDEVIDIGTQTCPEPPSLGPRIIAPANAAAPPAA